MTIDSLWQDLRLSIRMLRKSPGFACVAILALMTGIGVTTAIFSIVDSVLLRPLPYSDPDRIIAIYRTDPATGAATYPISEADFREFRSQAGSSLQLAGFVGSLPPVSTGGETERVGAGFVTSNYFSILGVNPKVGRSFYDGESAHVAILSWACWQSRFGSSEDLAALHLTVNGDPYTVIGVMPPGFVDAVPDFFKAAEFWVPHELFTGAQEHAIARLQPSVSFDQARAQLETISASVDQQQPKDIATGRLVVMPLHERFVGESRPALLMLILAVILLLVIACANVANLMFSRTTARHRELAIRAALGASRMRVVRQILTESLVLAITGGFLGMLLSVWGVKLIAAIGPKQILRLSTAHVDARALGFALLISVVSALLFGAGPAIQASRKNLALSLKQDSRQATDQGGGRMRGILTVCEVALSTILLIGAGLMVNSLFRLQHVNPGFNPDRLVLAGVLASPKKWQQPEQATAAFHDLVARVGRLPGVVSAAAATEGPLAEGLLLEEFDIDGRPAEPGAKKPDADTHSISPGYFDVIQAPMLRGRAFDDADDNRALPVVIVNQALAERCWHGGDPLGQRIKFVGGPPDSPWRTIVGIVGNINTESLLAAPHPQVYFPDGQRRSRYTTVIARTISDPAALVPAVRSAVLEMDKDQPPWHIETMPNYIKDFTAPSRFRMLLMLIFGIAAVILAAAGIYAVLSFAVERRTREIGIRMALGAGRPNVIRMIIRRGIAMSLVGTAIGVAASLGLGRLVAGLLFGVTPNDPFTIAAGAILILLVSLAASLIPANRGSRVDPAVALRCE